MKTIVLKIGGMHCEGCAETIKTLLEREPGVRMAEVTFKQGAARILYDPNTINEDRLARLIEEAGYRVVQRN